MATVTSAAGNQAPVVDASDRQIEASDIQAIVLRPRPKPYRGEYVILRIGDAGQGREMLRRILPHVAPADEWWVPSLPGWLGIPQRPVRRRLHGLPRFVVVRGGEYCFIPGLRALRWLAALGSFSA